MTHGPAGLVTHGPRMNKVIRILGRKSPCTLCPNPSPDAMPEPLSRSPGAPVGGGCEARGAAADTTSFKLKLSLLQIIFFVITTSDDDSGGGSAPADA